MADTASPREVVEGLMKAFAEVDYDFVAAIRSEGLRARLRELIADDAEVLFLVPSGGVVGDMGGPWAGADGMLAGFSEWSHTFDEFRFEPEDVIETDEGLALLLTTTYAVLPGSSTAVRQKAAAIYDVAEGRVVRIRFYLDQDQARREAGIE